MTFLIDSHGYITFPEKKDEISRIVHVYIMKMVCPDEFLKYPVCYIDHKNNEKKDLTLNNLRVVDPATNA